MFTTFSANNELTVTISWPQLQLQLLVIAWKVQQYLQFIIRVLGFEHYRTYYSFKQLAAHDQWVISEHDQGERVQAMVTGTELHV